MHVACRKWNRRSLLMRRLTNPAAAPLPLYSPPATAQRQMINAVTCHSEGRYRGDREGAGGQDELPATSPSSSQLQTRLDSSRLHFHVIVKATTIVTTTTTTTTTTIATTTSWASRRCHSKSHFKSSIPARVAFIIIHCQVPLPVIVVVAKVFPAAAVVVVVVVEMKCAKRAQTFLPVTFFSPFLPPPYLGLPFVTLPQPPPTLRSTWLPGCSCYFCLSWVPSKFAYPVAGLRRSESRLGWNQGKCWKIY